MCPHNRKKKDIYQSATKEEGKQVIRVCVYTKETEYYQKYSILIVYLF